MGGGAVGMSYLQNRSKFLTQSNPSVIKRIGSSQLRLSIVKAELIAVVDRLCQLLLPWQDISSDISFCLPSTTYSFDYKLNELVNLVTGRNEVGPW